MLITFRLLLSQLGLLLGLVATLTRAIQAQPLPRNFPVTDRPVAIVAGDFDGDGDQDVATADSYSNSISILDNLENTGVASARNFPLLSTSTALSTIVAGDVDGDADLDLVVGSYRTTGLALLRNNGDATFTEVETISDSVGDDVSSLVIGDLDGDGDLDLAIGTDFAINIFKNDGNGTFTLSQVKYLIRGSASDVAVGDLDGDGDLDLAATAGYDYTVYIAILKNDGTGNFRTTSSRDSSREYPTSIAVGDLDGDADLDLVVGNADVNSVTVLENNGDATFGPSHFFANSGPAYDVALGDVDGDGQLDVVTVVARRNLASVLFNRGSAQLAAPLSIRVGQSPRSLVAQDLNGDAQVDLATANSGSDDVTLLLNP
ncbi:VCBS repeat-containing protein [Candidatus Cyanaurora vandensis]|uniref:FG-GAP repeat domain-containing protein n=1 Tax=Candidatus Cyanaurora vandensis TaxID=2714958 RepID=UPI00257A8688|nr:VCBS repeat-containing protein [Candidatus Cyanaurora vandensis]